MSNKYIVIEIGCIECGVSSQLVGVFDSKELAKDIAATLNANHRWRDGGDNIFLVFKLGEVNAIHKEYQGPNLSNLLIGDVTECPECKGVANSIDPDDLRGWDGTYMEEDECYRLTAKVDGAYYLDDYGIINFSEGDTFLYCKSKLINIIGFKP